MCSFYLFVIAALQAIVVAHALSSQSLPISILLTKKSTLKTVEGRINPSSIRSHILSIEAKLQRGAAAFEKNTGVALFSTSLFKRGAPLGSDPLVDDSNQRWYGTIAVGTPPQNFSIDCDTGSADFFLPGPSCGDACDGHQVYYPNISSSAQALAKNFTVEYGDGSMARGELYTDTVSLGGFDATAQTLGVASLYSHQLSSENFGADGMMGMAFKSISKFGADSVFQTLVSQGAVPEPIFAFKLASSGSELSIGGVNSALYKDPVTYNPINQSGYWQIAGDAIGINGKDVINNFSAIVDTGTTLIVGDTTHVSQLYQAINATGLGGGVYSLPCDAMPNVTIILGGKSFEISTETFNFGIYDSSGNTCFGGIVGSEGLGDLWILGDVFLRNVYTIFDVGNYRVGFAELA